MSISKGTILNLSSNTDVYERGERYFHEGKLLSFKTQTDPEGGSVVRSGIEGNYKNYEVVLRLNENGSLSSYTCNCESHNIWRGACKHVVAVLFAQMEGGAPTQNGVLARQHGTNLIHTLERLILEGVDAELELPPMTGEVAVNLVPALQWDSRGVSVTFSLGTTRLYMIKNIMQFAQSCEREEVISYGAELKFAHKRANFVPEGLLEFILAEASLYAEMEKQLVKYASYSRRGPLAGREMPINSRNIDAFFALHEGQTLAGSGNFAREILLSAGKPPLAMYITHEDNATRIKGELEEFLVISSRKHNYLILKSGILRLPLADGAFIVQLLHALKDAPRGEIIFSGDEERRFLTMVLPRLIEMELVPHTQGTPRTSRPTPPECRVYLDADGRDVVARVEFWYGRVKVEDTDSTGSADDIPRDAVAEYGLHRALTACGFIEKNGSFRLHDDDAIFRLLYDENNKLDELKKRAQIFLSEDLTSMTHHASKPQIGVRLSGGLLEINMSGTDFSLEEMMEALKAFRARKKYFRLRDGRFITATDEALTAPLQLLDALNVRSSNIKGKTLTVPAYRALAVEETAKIGNWQQALSRNKRFEKLVKDFAKSGEADEGESAFRVPRTLAKVLREYQKTGYRWLKTLAHYGFGGILADDMGLGKTLQIIAVLESTRTARKAQSQALPSLIVVPTSLLYNWQNELARFAPKLQALVISGTAERRRELLETAQADVLITTYDMLKRDLVLYENKEFSTLVADEAQNIKNPSTQAAKSIKSLKSRTRFALTGTPIENNLTELWSIFDFIMPGYLHSARTFAKLYEVPIVRDGDTERAARLRRQIAPFVLRRIKSNVLSELPEKTETTLPAEFTNEQKLIYQAYLLKAKGLLDDLITRDEFNTGRISILAQLTRLRQICCHPSLFVEGYDGGSGKFTLTLETIQIALESGHRVLLFSQFTRMLEKFRAELDANSSASYFYLDGATPSKERMQMCDRFNSGERDIFLISLKAGGTGLNLTGADVVIHYDPWWNPSVKDQASDRAHRLGQKKSVQVFKIVAKDSIEEKILVLQEKKRGLIDTVITQGGSFINALSAEEVRRLLTE